MSILDSGEESKAANGAHEVARLTTRLLSFDEVISKEQFERIVETEKQEYRSAFPNYEALLDYAVRSRLEMLIEARVDSETVQEHISKMNEEFEKELVDAISLSHKEGMSFRGKLQAEKNAKVKWDADPKFQTMVKVYKLWLSKGKPGKDRGTCGYKHGEKTRFAEEAYKIYCENEKDEVISLSGKRKSNAVSQETIVDWISSWQKGERIPKLPK